MSNACSFIELDIFRQFFLAETDSGKMTCLHNVKLLILFLLESFEANFAEPRKQAVNFSHVIGEKFRGGKLQLTLITLFLIFTEKGH